MSIERESKPSLGELARQKRKLASSINRSEYILGQRQEKLRETGLDKSLPSAIQTLKIFRLTENITKYQQQLEQVKAQIVSAGLPVLERWHRRGLVSDETSEHWNAMRTNENTTETKDVTEVVEIAEVVKTEIAIIESPKKPVKRDPKLAPKVVATPTFIPTRDTNLVALAYLAANSEADLSEVIQLYQAEAQREISTREVAGYLKTLLDELFDNFTTDIPDSKLQITWQDIRTTLGSGTDISAWFKLRNRVRLTKINGNGSNHRPLDVSQNDETISTPLQEEQKLELENMDPIIRAMITEYIKEIIPIMPPYIGWPIDEIRRKFSFANSWSSEFITRASALGVIKPKKGQDRDSRHVKYGNEDVVALLYHDQSLIKFNPGLSQHLRKIVSECMDSYVKKQANDLAETKTQDINKPTTVGEKGPATPVVLTDEIKRSLGLDEKARTRAKLARKLALASSRVSSKRIFERTTSVTIGEALDAFPYLSNNGLLSKLTRQFTTVLGVVDEGVRRLSREDVETIIVLAQEKDPFKLSREQVVTIKSFVERGS